MATQVKPSRVRIMIDVASQLRSESPQRASPSDLIFEGEQDLFVRNNRRADEAVQFRKFFVHIGVAAFE
jgi:hypothetical protein